MLEPLPSTSGQSKECFPNLVGNSRSSLQVELSLGEASTSPKRPKQNENYYVTQELPPVTNVVHCTLKLEYSVAAFDKIGIVVPAVDLPIKMCKSGRALRPPSRIRGARLPVRIGPCAERLGRP